MSSAYPGGLDSFATSKSDGTQQGFGNHADHHNDLADAVNKIEGELGTNPSGAYSTVAAALLAALGASAIVPETRSVNAQLDASDIGKLIDVDSAITQTIDSATLLGAGWWVILRNATTDGTTIVTVAPGGAQTIDGLVTMTMYSHESRLVISDGTNFLTHILHGGFAVFTGISEEFIHPAGISEITVDSTGQGCGGGGGRGGSAGTVRQGGTGAGGGARVILKLAVPILGGTYGPGDAIPVVVEQGVPGGAGGTNADGTSPIAGVSNTFGGESLAYGGGAGRGGSTGTAKSGGAGGGAGEVGQSGSTAARAGGGQLSTGTVGMGGVGACAVTGITGGYGAEWGGASGGGIVATGGQGSQGGDSLYGGGGGGAGGSTDASNVDYAGGNGGYAGFFSVQGGHGPNGGTAPGGAGVDGADGNHFFSGQGGSGGASNNAGTGGKGGNGGVPGGPGGGGGGGTPTGGPGGDGARGEIRVTYS